jgi:mono/diheme cytochrome c family protein
MNCAHCHGDDARGDEGPDLHNLHRSDARIHEVITVGIKGEMPSFGKKLGDPDVRQLIANQRLDYYSFARRHTADHGRFA